MPRVRWPVRPGARASIACPAGVDVPGFVAAIARGDHDDAAARRSSPRTCSAAPARGSVRSRCSARAPACSGTRDEAPIEIGRLQRFATDVALEGGTSRFGDAASAKLVSASPSSAPGPAGLACAGRARRAWLRRHGLRRARRAGRARPLRDRAVPPAARTAAGGGLALRGSASSSSSGSESTPPTRSPTSNPSQRRGRPRSRDGAGRGRGISR